MIICVSNPNARCQGHKKEAYCRATVSPNASTVIFVPKPLSGEESAATQLKRAAFGASLLGHLKTLEGCEHGEVIWDCALVKDPPAMIRPLRPRFWLLCEVELEVGKYYQLTDMRA